VIISETTSNTASAAIVVPIAIAIAISGAVGVDPVIPKTGAVFDVIGAVLCVVGVAVMANVVGLV
jgi:drug/metabolite transporter superfamily protein YnfA